MVMSKTNLNQHLFEGCRVVLLRASPAASDERRAGALPVVYRFK